MIRKGDGKRKVPKNNKYKSFGKTNKPGCINFTKGKMPEWIVLQLLEIHLRVRISAHLKVVSLEISVYAFIQ